MRRARARTRGSAVAKLVECVRAAALWIERAGRSAIRFSSEPSDHLPPAIQSGVTPRTPRRWRERRTRPQWRSLWSAPGTGALDRGFGRESKKLHFPASPFPPGVVARGEQTISNHENNPARRRRSAWRRDPQYRPPRHKTWNTPQPTQIMKYPTPFLALLLLLSAWPGASTVQAATAGAVVAWGNNGYGLSDVPVAAQFWFTIGRRAWGFSGHFFCVALLPALPPYAPPLPLHEPCRP